MKQIAPLSKSQYGIYAECVSHENEVFYNLPFLFVFDGSLDADRLCRAIEMTIKAHPTFFTRIGVADDGEPFQSVDMEKEDFNLTVEQVLDLEAEKQSLTEALNNESDYQKLQQMGNRLQEIKDLLDEKELRWLELDEIGG